MGEIRVKSANERGITEQEKYVASRAACKGMYDLFFEEEVQQRIDAAKTICRSCPVERECLEWAISIRYNVGVAGGMSSRERRSVIRKLQSGANSRSYEAV